MRPTRRAWRGGRPVRRVREPQPGEDGQRLRSWDHFLAWLFAVFVAGAFLWFLGQLVPLWAAFAGLVAVAVLIWELRRNILQ